MLSVKTAHMIALSQPEAKEEDHFGSPSIRVRGTIFAPLSAVGAEEERVLIKFSPADQAALTMMEPETVCSVPNWGRFGRTHVRLAGIDEALLGSLLFKSWQLVAPRTLAAEVLSRR